MTKDAALMSDEEFLNNPIAEETQPNTSTGTEETTPSTEGEETSATSQAEAPVAETTPQESTEEKSQPPVDDQQISANNAPEVSSVGSKETETAKPDAANVTTAPEAKASTEPTTEDYAAFYKQVMAPFKANGKMIQLRDPQEAIQLMQMGANYTRKLQELQPHRKVLLMLQNNGLLDEGKLSYLIDLDKRNPEAIKKLVKDAGIDPLEIDTTAEPAYLAGNHKVTDAEANFRSALEELQASPEGKSTLQTINDRWDQASKEVLWKQPELIATIHNQREAGVYQIVVDEIERQRVLGQLPPNTTFIDAYRIVGDRLLETDAFDHLPAIKQLKPQKQAPQPVTTRVAAPKPAFTNGDKASAASPSRSTPRTATTVNPLPESDEEFLKRMENRV